MKAMIITCHTPYNYGAVLQCYALMRYLREQGLVVEVIDFETPKSKKKASIMNIIIYGVRSIDFVLCKKIFGDFIKNNLILTKKSYRTGEDLLRDNLEADVYIAGSDQIWNYELPNGSEDAFYLDFVKNGRKVSYAASIGLDQLPDIQKERYYKLLSSFHGISVREKSGEKLLKSIGLKACTVLDPVFLLSRRDWYDFFKPAMLREKERYILVYSFCRQEEIYTYARKLGKRHNLKVYSVSNLWSDIRFDHDKFFWNPTIEKFLSLIYQADHMVTNSYHGLCYSIIFKRNIHMFRHREAANLRMSDLMDTLGISDRWIDKEQMELLEADIDYEKVNKVLTLEKKNSKEFIKKYILS